MKEIALMLIPSQVYYIFFSELWAKYKLQSKINYNNYIYKIQNSIKYNPKIF